MYTLWKLLTIFFVVFTLLQEAKSHGRAVEIFGRVQRRTIFPRKYFPINSLFHGRLKRPHSENTTRKINRNHPLQGNYLPNNRFITQNSTSTIKHIFQVEHAHNRNRFLETTLTTKMTLKETNTSKIDLIITKTTQGIPQKIEEKTLNLNTKDNINGTLVNDTKTVKTQEELMDTITKHIKLNQSSFPGISETNRAISKEFLDLLESIIKLKKNTSSELVKALENHNINPENVSEYVQRQRRHKDKKDFDTLDLNNLYYLRLGPKSPYDTSSANIPTEIPNKIVTQTLDSLSVDKHANQQSILFLKKYHPMPIPRMNISTVTPNYGPTPYYNKNFFKTSVQPVHVILDEVRPSSNGDNLRSPNTPNTVCKDCNKSPMIHALIKLTKKMLQILQSHLIDEYTTTIPTTEIITEVSTSTTEATTEIVTSTEITTTATERTTTTEIPTTTYEPEVTHLVVNNFTDVPIDCDQSTDNIWCKILVIFLDGRNEKILVPRPGKILHYKELFFNFYPFSNNSKFIGRENKEKQILKGKDVKKLMDKNTHIHIYAPAVHIHSPMEEKYVHPLQYAHRSNAIHLLMAKSQQTTSELPTSTKKPECEEETTISTTATITEQPTTGLSFLRLLVEAKDFDKNWRNQEKPEEKKTRPTAILIPILTKNASFNTHIKNTKHNFNLTVHSKLQRKTTEPMIGILMLAPSNDSMVAFRQLKEATEINVITPPTIIKVPKRCKKEVMNELNIKFGKSMNTSFITKDVIIDDTLRMAMLSFPDRDSLDDEINAMKNYFSIFFGSPISFEKVKSYLEFFKDGDSFTHN